MKAFLEEAWGWILLVGCLAVFGWVVHYAMHCNDAERAEIDQINATIAKTIEAMEVLAAEEVRLMTAETKKNQQERWKRLEK